MEKVRLGLIGMGMIGKVHAETMSRMKEVEFVAASDIDLKHRNTAEGLGVRFYPSYEEMISKERLEGVVVAVPNELHLSVGAACAQKGLHILMEKPIAADLESADRLIQVARENKVHLMVGHHRRHNPLVEELRNIVRGGKIGKLVGVTVLWSLYKPRDYFQGPFAWRAKPGGGPIRINLIHEIDNIRYICGEVKRLYAEVSNEARKFPVEDTVSINLRLDNGAVANIFFTDTAPGNIGYEANTGENPFFYHSPENCYLYYGTEAVIVFPRMKKLFYRDPERTGWQYPLSEEGMKIDREDPYTRQIRNFCGVIRGTEMPKIDGEDARKTLEVTLAIQKSGETGQPILFD
ncbi:MAG: Gfo/Idh/MocA family oxidoreductase [Desulfobacterota bacterium]|nr:Gfo/Idh/MocA family oxidoreductase [Thermodesulfobacteriota bacterium]